MVNLTFVEMDWIIGGNKSQFEDDEIERCSKCDCNVYFRPFVERTKKSKLICFNCFIKIEKEDENEPRMENNK